MPELSVIFMGSAELSCPSLSALLRDPATKVVAVVTQPDRPKGRGLKLTPSPVKTLGLEAGLPILQPQRAREPSFLEELRGLRPDLVVVAAYGQILPGSILNLPVFGCINVHTSLLPKYRGAGPIQWAIINGETETGVTIMRMDEGLDTGDILSQERITIEPDDTSATLHNKLAEIGARLLVQTIPDFVSGKIAPQKQDPAKATYAPKIKKQDGEIDWRQPATVIRDRIRGLNPWPAAFTWLSEPEKQRLKILKADVKSDCGAPGTILKADKDALVVACGSDALQVLELQLEGSRAMESRQFLLGHPLAPGQSFQNRAD
jgi:methionyl-tRNA formyltransferase